MMAKSVPMHVRGQYMKDIFISFQILHQNVKLVSVDNFYWSIVEWVIETRHGFR